jgi:hypothetical protein
VPKSRDTYATYIFTTLAQTYKNAIKALGNITKEPLCPNLYPAIRVSVYFIGNLNTKLL